MPDDKRAGCIRISPDIWELFDRMVGRSKSSKIEDWIVEYLGISSEQKRNQLYLKRQEYIKLGKEISKMELDIEETDRILMDKLRHIWADFRKRFTVFHDEWENDKDIVVVLQNDYGIVLSYDQLYKVWPKMEELNVHR